MISPTGYVQSIEASYVYSSIQPLSPYANAAQFGIPNVEYIPHRIFVGGFSPVTKEDDLRNFFQRFGSIREVKVIKNIDGISKGYGFVTFETEEEANNVRNMDPETLQIRGRRLNLGPALRRVCFPRYDYGSMGNAQAAPNAGGAVGANGGAAYWPAFGCYAYAAYPNSQPVLVVSPTASTAPAAAQVLFGQTPAMIGGGGVDGSGGAVSSLSPRE